MSHESTPKRNKKEHRWVSLERFSALLESPASRSAVLSMIGRKEIKQLDQQEEAERQAAEVEAADLARIKRRQRLGVSPRKERRRASTKVRLK